MSYHLRNTLTAVAAVVALGTAAHADEPTVKEVMQRFGAIGLPTYVILEPNTAGQPG